MIGLLRNKICAVLYTPIGRLINDEAYLKLLWRLRMGSDLDLEHPNSFNEKLQWLKLYDRNPSHRSMVDKHLVKALVSERIGERYVIPTLDCREDPRGIDFGRLPVQFVAKCTHDSGSVLVCEDKASLDREAFYKHFDKRLSQSTYWKLREWPYKDLTPKVIIEPFLSELGGDQLIDYKVLCFSGKPKAIEVHQGRRSAHTQNFVDLNWVDTRISQPAAQCSAVLPSKPECLDEMISLSAQLAEGLPHVRVDWYIIGGKLFFGELTFFDGSGFAKFDRPEVDTLFGSWIDLSMAFYAPEGVLVDE